MGGLSPLGSKLYMKLQLETSIYQEVEKLYDELSEYYQLLYPDIEESNRRIAKEIDLKILKPMNSRPGKLKRSLNVLAELVIGNRAC